MGIQLHLDFTFLQFILEAIYSLHDIEFAAELLGDGTSHQYRDNKWKKTKKGKTKQVTDERKHMNWERGSQAHHARTGATFLPIYKQTI